MNVDCDATNMLSLCSGYGGLDLGLDLATGGATRTVCYVEREAFAAAILAARMEEKALDAAPIWSDLRTFDGRPWRGVVDCITGGYPCQPFSQAGRRLGERDERHLWPEIARIIAEVEPGVVFLENVPGHLSLGFDAVCDDLHGMGFRVAAGLFSASEVGAPHRRERLFILGIVADGDGGRREVVGRGGLRPDGDAPRRHDVDRRDGAAADLDDTKTQGCRFADLGQGPFPPGPADIGIWRHVLAARPDLAPAVESDIRRVADGVAPRLDRLRALGNGVVPLAAAYAFVSLWACVQSD